MESIRYVGIDYHTNTLQICVLDERGQVLVNRPCSNNWHAVVKASQTKTAGRVMAAIEVGNGADHLADELVLYAGWSVDLGHPGYIRRMRQHEDKTDFTDARMLADLERVGYLPKVWCAPPAIRELRRLVKFRQSKIDQRRAIKLRITGLLRNARVGKAPANRWTKRWMQWLREEVELPSQTRWIIDVELEELAAVQHLVTRIDKQLEAVTREDPLVRKLRAQSCVGLVTAVSLRASIGRFDRFKTGKQLSKFCGLSPRNASSGDRKAEAGLVRGCDRRLRSTLIETAHRLMRSVPHWQSLARRLRERGKSTCEIAVAVANRWVRWLHGRMKTLGLEDEAMLNAMAIPSGDEMVMNNENKYVNMC